MTASYTCTRCNGLGTVAFKHVAEGVCFACRGAGKVAFKGKVAEAVELYPEAVVSEANRSTDKQWAFLDKLCGDNSDVVCKILRKAGSEHACQRYVSKAVMSAAIEIAKSDRDAIKWRTVNRTMAA